MQYVIVFFLLLKPTSLSSHFYSPNNKLMRLNHKIAYILNKVYSDL